VISAGALPCACAATRPSPSRCCTG
jgi:hypothetical protein